MNRIRPFALLVPLLVVIGLAPVTAAAADGPGLRSFTVTVTGTTPGAMPDVYAGDADAVLTIRLTNRSTQQSLGSANVTVPAPFTVLSAPGDTVPGGPLLELRNLNLAPGAFRDFTVTIDVRTCTPTTPDPFVVTARQSNDYRSSATGNEFLLTTPSDLQLNAVGACSLGFVDEPASATRGSTITSASFAPAGSAISAQVLDAGGTGRATFSSAVVTIAAANPSVPSPVLGGTTSATAAGGLATFAPGPTLATSAFNYTLTASAAEITTSPASGPFAIVDDAVNCLADQACTRTGTANKAGQSVSVTFGTGQSNTTLLVSIDAADAPAFVCAGYPRPAGTYVTQFLFAGGSGSDRIGTMSTSTPGSATKPLTSYQACWAAPYPFVTRAGTPAVVQGTKPGTNLPLYVGLLPDCGTQDVSPCVKSRTNDRSTGRVTVTVLTTGEDPWRY